MAQTDVPYAAAQVGLLGWCAMRVFDRFAHAAIHLGLLRIILPNGEELHYGDDATVDVPTPPGTADLLALVCSCLFALMSIASSCVTPRLPVSMCPSARQLRNFVVYVSVAISLPRLSKVLLQSALQRRAASLPRPSDHVQGCHVGTAP